LKLFVKAFEKESPFRNPNDRFVKEKLMVCASLVQRRISLKKADEILDCPQKNERTYTGQHLTMQEHAFILRAGYPESYIRFIKREDWFLAIKKQLKGHFSKNKTLKTKEEKILSKWESAYNFIKDLLSELKE